MSSSPSRASFDDYYQQIFDELDDDDYTPSPALSGTVNLFSRSPSSAAQTIVAEDDENAFKNVETDSILSDDDPPYHDIDFNEQPSIDFHSALLRFGETCQDLFVPSSILTNMPVSPTQGFDVDPSNLQSDLTIIPPPQSSRPTPVFNLDIFKSARTAETPLKLASETTEMALPGPTTESHLDRPIIPLRTGTRASRSRKLSVIIAPSDNEDSDIEPDDDDYCPPPPLNPKKRTRSSQSIARAPKKAKVVAKGGTTTSLSKPKVTAKKVSTGSPDKPKVARKQRLPPASRNVQVVGINLLELLETMEWKCKACKWEQENHRKPDFIRHLLTHQRPDKDDQSQGWWCKGLKILDREAYNRLAIRDGRQTISEDAGEIVFLFERRVGGCGRNFSRRDALKRHIDNPNTPCCGYALEPFQEFDHDTEKIITL
ncbi:uncharacterized protein BT62DRAFT_343642 [Guyanagaster necrorhizus]|uniref:Uncharacterized protein n=1 Tax=Guyanagaster necrorhizus TaxID=856835 RepID=A0A9P8APN7_9AGAR|nr:uncharacterized protein BT62DRAFT_343642 [Guyanagaster necrorhizus MCA 3950]KAG7442986.1 hypothetical protein BT62DRAFT_343642 [Guyanagaster necrorhizus MCA 3950]